MEEEKVFKVPSAMKKKWSSKQQDLFLAWCASNRAGREFLSRERDLISDYDMETLIHNIVFNTVCDYARIYKD